jgi:hypothetical protein
MSTQTTTKPKPFCFVLMPFDSSFNDIYEFGIKGACEDAGLYCERVDEQIFVGSMLERIYNQIARADLLVADMTGKNPNVFYEVGYAHALGKNVVLLTSVAQDIPFDLKHFPHIVYGTAIKALRTDLAKRLKHLATEEPTRSETQIGLDLFLMDARLIDAPGTVVTYSRDNDRGARLTLVNNSTLTYEPGEFSVAVIAPAPFDTEHWNGQGILLQDGQYLHSISTRGKLFPGAVQTIGFYLETQTKDPPTEFDVIIRIFSSAGFRDFPLRFSGKNINIQL